MPTSKLPRNNLPMIEKGATTMTMIRTTLGYTTAVMLALGFFIPSAQGGERLPCQPPDEIEIGEAFRTTPFDFRFGNHIDTHQLTTVVDGQLCGSFYIIFWSPEFEGGPDPDSGLPLARHPRGASHQEVCGVDVVCYPGWSILAEQGQAKFLYHSGVNGNDHPVWMVNRGEASSTTVSAIPQPGSFTHFHWIANQSDGTTDPRALDPGISAACDKNNAGQLETQAPTAVNEVCQGWFLQIETQKDRPFRDGFAFQHGGETIVVRPGMDNRSHLNLVTNYAVVPTITETRNNSGH